MGGYFFQPRSISHNAFIPAADWSRQIHEAAENDDNTEETPDGGEQSADTRTTLPALDPDHASNPQAPNRLSRASHMENLTTILSFP